MVRTKVLQNIFMVTILILLAYVSHAKSPKRSLKGFRLDLSHIDSKGKFSKIELLHRMIHRSHHRMHRFARKTQNQSPNASKHGTKTDVTVGSGEFVMDIAIGTPSVTFPAIIDTGSDLIWTQCKPCIWCFPQPTPIFNPSASSSYRRLPCTAKLCKSLPFYNCIKNNTSCQYMYGYGDGSYTIGNLSSETFTLGSKKAHKVAFGCGNKNSDGFDKSSGLVGLGRSKLSLVSQLKFKEFSYCFASLDETKQSPMFFGDLAYLNVSTATGPAQSTPLLKNKVSSFYYLSLLGITVGKTKLNVPSTVFALQSNGSGGTIIDSGTAISYLEMTGYKAVRSAFISQMKLPVANSSDAGFDLCFKAPSHVSSFVVPKFIFHFEGADLDLPKSNYFLHEIENDLLCLTIMGSSGISIIGSMQQQNFKIIYDLKKNKLTFIPVQCDKL
ncbi:Eukaryotic aspartyl protease family protein [Rhynchospora pubera]|uniref:nepenthesin n=1 Tax=Rhynchospora pubera TaxID=906938 RepID=A0AAV8HPG7_9POAL|nr:Eukaryotic aspartyl protease family protein [Rhynchospora pubera]